MSARGKIAFPRLYRHADGRTMSEARSISTATMAPGDIHATQAQRGKERDEKKEGLNDGCGENRGECKKPGESKRPVRVSQIVSYKSKNSLLSCAARTRKSEKLRVSDVMEASWVSRI